MTTPKPPTNLRDRGRNFWRQVMRSWVPDPAEIEVLTEVCRLLDELDALQAAATPVVVTGSRSQPRTNPAIVEVHRARAQLTQLLAALQLEGTGILSPASVHGRRAARGRWSPTLIRGDHDASS